VTQRAGGKKERKYGPLLKFRSRAAGTGKVPARFKYEKGKMYVLEDQITQEETG